MTKIPPCAIIIPNGCDSEAIGIYPDHMTMNIFCCVSAGVGDGAVRNRYCAVAFGGFGVLERGHFLEVDGQRCFFAPDFPRAR